MRQLKELLNQDIEFVFDSRKVHQNSIFVALLGGTIAGDLFAKNAFEMGAKFLILNKEPDFEISKTQYIVTSNSLNFITNLAKEKFANLKKRGVVTIALTGSTGKTTTKEFLYFLFQKCNLKVYANYGNFNNHIGVPFTILNAPNDINYLILEMGMNNLGEISHLIDIAPTDIRIITNVSSAHEGNFKEGLKGIAFAKAEILQKSSQNTTLITIENLPFFKEIIENFNGNIIKITENEIKNYLIKENKTFFDYNNYNYFVNKIVTKNWLLNFLLCFKVCEILKINLPLNIANFTLPSGRGYEYKLSKNTVLIDESYNASPVSMLNSIMTINLFQGKKLLVLGGMKELGISSERHHIDIIKEVLKNEQIDVIFVGEEFKQALNSLNIKNYTWFLSPEEVKVDVNKYNYILAKSSNSSGISKFVNKIKIDYGKQ